MRRHSSRLFYYVLTLIEGLFNALFSYYVLIYNFLKILRISYSVLTSVKMDVGRQLLIVCTLACD